MSKSARERHIKNHNDGSLWSQGWMRDGEMDGHWEWFRKDGTKMRSGNFDMGRQIGEWITYDAKGEVYKVTRMK